MADQRIQATEEMVGYGHATKADTLNRHGMVEHLEDGTHQKAISHLTASLPVFTDADKKLVSKTASQAAAAIGSDLMIKGDGTAGLVMRAVYLAIQNGTNATTVKPSTTSKFNGDVNAPQDNLGKGGSAGVWSLSAGGDVLTLLGTGITGDPVGVLAAYLNYNSSGTALTCYATVSGGNIVITLYNATSGVAVDLTTLVDTGIVQIDLTYITSA